MNLSTVKKIGRPLGTVASVLGLVLWAHSAITKQTASLVALVETSRFTLPPSLVPEGRRERALRREYGWIQSVWEIRISSVGELPCDGVVLEFPEARRARILKGLEVGGYGLRTWESYTELGQCVEINKVLRIGAMLPKETLRVLAWSPAWPGRYQGNEVKIYFADGVATTYSEIPAVNWGTELAEWCGDHWFAAVGWLCLFALIVYSSIGWLLELLRDSATFVLHLARRTTRGMVSGTVRYTGPQVTAGRGLRVPHKLLLYVGTEDNTEPQEVEVYARSVSEQSLGREHEYRLLVPPGRYSICAYWDIDDDLELTEGHLKGCSMEFEVGARGHAKGIDIELKPYIADRGAPEKGQPGDSH